MNLDKLIYLVNKKNDLNRRRRRFHYHGHNMNNSREEQLLAWDGYHKAQDDMKVMTPAISELRKELNAKLNWNKGGLVTFIRVDDKYIHHTQFKPYVMSYLAERELLGE